MSVFEQAKSIYAALRYDSESLQTIRDEYKSLALLIATDINASTQVTSTTINGQTISTRPNMTNGERLALLRYVVFFADRGGAISSTVLPRF